MYDTAFNNNLKLYIKSPYKSYSTQTILYNNYKATDGMTAADTYSARAGYSEHQIGLAIDIVSATTSFATFEKSQEFAWLQENAHLFGFILRYPSGKEYITGYQFESWHYRYVGIDVATFIHKTDLTFE